MYVMTELRAKACSDPWLARVQFPGMKIHHRRLLLDAIDLPQRPPRERIREKPEVSAAADAPVVAAPTNGRRWKLKDGVTAGSEMPVREALGIRHSVQIVPNRKDG